MIFNFGSINIDHIYRVSHLPEPGETLAAITLSRELGGKGANQSIAASRAGSRICHIGSIGEDGEWTRAALAEGGVDVTHISVADTPTGHAMIMVESTGENAIVIFPGANEKQSLTSLRDALKTASAGDIMLLQNETNLQAEAARLAREREMRVIYSAAPFELTAVKAILPLVDLLVMNAGEAAQFGQTPDCAMLVTDGAQGAHWITTEETFHVPSAQVTAVDTTGAGDCFIGYVAAGIDQGLVPLDAMRLGVAASALQVQEEGTARAIPSRARVDQFLSSGIFS